MIYPYRTIESLDLLCDDRKLLQNEEYFVIVLTDEDDDKKNLIVQIIYLISFRHCSSDV